MTCNHCPKNWSKSDTTLLEKAKGNCSLCDAVGPKLWACLENDCEFVGCPKSLQDHNSKHFQETNHAVAVNLVSFRCWCNICQKEIYMTGHFTASEMKAKVAKLRKVEEHADLAEEQPPVESPLLATPSKCVSLSSLQELLLGESLAEDSAPGLTGLRNLGNTCYMNAALQSLSNCPQLTLHFLALGRFYGLDKNKLMAPSYYRLVSDMWSFKFASVSPTAVNNSVKTVNPMFRGHQQQDTQELLRCLMDRLHEETKFSFPATDAVTSKQEAGDADVGIVVSHPPSSSGDQAVVEDATSMTISSSSDDSYRSCESLNATGIEPKSSRSDDTQPMLTDTDFPKELDELHSSGSPLFRSNSFPSLTKKLPPAESISDAARKRTTSHSTPVMEDVQTRGEMARFSMRTCNGLRPHVFADVNHFKITKSAKVVEEQHSVISDIFDGALWSSVQCKTCNSVWHTKETFQDLSLPIPGKDDTVRLHGLNPSQLPLPVPNPATGPCANSESYGYRLYEVWEWVKSWFFGPQVTLIDCLSAFFSADDLKGDNMYSCEKCKNRLCSTDENVAALHGGSTMCTPRSKMRNLDLSRYVASDCISQVKTYNLSSVIVHQGGAGGGHYTAYCLNPVNGKWYEFDDQYVTEVQENVVAGAEAYVLFYSKTDESSSSFRDDVLRMEDSVHRSVLMRFFISVQWMTRFLTHVEPGPINNNYFLCKHGSVKPSIASNVSGRVCCVPEQVWHALHQRFGGGPAVTRMLACEICIAEAKRIQERRVEEQKMYMKLSQGHEDDYQQQTYFISMAWFRKWQAFIQGDKDPPEEIDNNPIAKAVDGKLTVKKDSDFGELTSDAWKYLHDRYGGGPIIPRNSMESSIMEVA